jgi:hypothetical protein
MDDLLQCEKNALNAFIQEHYPTNVKSIEASWTNEPGFVTGKIIFNSPPGAFTNIELETTDDLITTVRDLGPHWS